jgi:hypothetical protein
LERLLIVEHHASTQRPQVPFHTAAIANALNATCDGAWSRAPLPHYKGDFVRSCNQYCDRVALCVHAVAHAFPKPLRGTFGLYYAFCVGAVLFGFGAGWNKGTGRKFCRAVGVLFPRVAWHKAHSGKISLVAGHQICILLGVCPCPLAWDKAHGGDALVHMHQKCYLAVPCPGSLRVPSMRTAAVFVGVIAPAVH